MITLDYLKQEGKITTSNNMLDILEFYIIRDTFLVYLDECCLCNTNDFETANEVFTNTVINGDFIIPMGSENETDEGDLTLEQFKKRMERHEGHLTISNEEYQLESIQISSGKILIMFNSKCFYSGNSVKTALKNFNHFKSKYKL